MAPSSYFLSHGVQADPCPGLPLERGPQDAGVGSWVPALKHRLLAEYLWATRHAWASPQWRHRVFIDPFCGPGRVQVEGETGTRDGGAVVAWREAQAAGVPFTHVFVGDKDPARANACAERLRALGAPATAFAGAASQTVPQMVAQVPHRALCMAYVDPYNLSLLSFDLLQALAALRVDIAAHFSTMDLTRNVELEFDPARERFDATAPGWRHHAAVLAASKRNVPIEFFNYWMGLVGALKFRFSQAMPLVTNNEGRPIYRLVFFARHPLPLRVWADVAKGGNPQLPLL